MKIRPGRFRFPANSFYAVGGFALGRLLSRFTLALFCVAIFFAGAISVSAQLAGPGSAGVSASLIRIFGTNNAFTAQAEIQVLGPDKQERIGTPMMFTLLGNKIRVEVDMTRMRNRAEPDAIAKVKPLGLDHVVSIIRPETRSNLIVFPKLSAYVRLDMPEAEAEAFLKRARMERTTIGKEKMEGYNCIKQRVVITDNSGKKSEATVWIAPELRNFPVCVATPEAEGTVVVRFRKVDFTAAPLSQFEPPPGFQECADMQVLMAGPVVKFMKENKTAIKASPPPKTTSTRPAQKNTAPAKSSAAPAKKK